LAGNLFDPSSTEIQRETLTGCVAILSRYNRSFYSSTHQGGIMSSSALLVALSFLFVITSHSYGADDHESDRSPHPGNVQMSGLGSIQSARFDLQFSFDASAASGAAGNAGSEFDGTYYYTTRWASNLIHKYDMSGVLVQEFSIPGVSGLRDLAFDGTYMYGGAAANTIYQMDFNTMTLIGTIPSPVAVRHIAYDPVDDGFWVGTWDTDLVLVDRGGATLNVISTSLVSKYGSAYDGWSDGGPYLWVFDQGAGADTPQLVHQFDISTGLPTGVTYDVGADFVSAGDIAGGLFSTEGIVPGTASLGGLLQGTPNFFFVYELAETGSSEPLAQPGVFYGTTGSAEPTYPGYLLTIDPSTGVGTLVGPTGIPSADGPSVRALAIKSTGEMYAMSHTASSDLYSVNASTGAGIFVANTGLLFPGDICFDAEDVLYGVDDTNVLYTIDENTGTRTVVGPTGVTLGGLAYDPTDGTMYGSGTNDDIYTIDLATGAVTLVGTTGLGGNTPDILFDQAGNLFGTKRGSGGVYDYIAIDKATGAGTVIGSIGFIAVVGLATRLEPPQAIPCTDVATFQTRCRVGGTIQARLTLANTNYTGEVVEFSIDGAPYQVTVGSNGRAQLSVGVFDVGEHTVELTIPAGCVDPAIVRCRQGNALSDAELWDDESGWEVPGPTAMYGNYPNPFNPSTTFRYSLSEQGEVSIRIYNMLGQVVKTVVNQVQTAGYHEVKWDGTNETGSKVSSGIYVYRMEAGRFVETNKLLLLK
jgi:hypothetical protein